MPGPFYRAASADQSQQRRAQKCPSQRLQTTGCGGFVRILVDRGRSHFPRFQVPFPPACHSVALVLGRPLHLFASSGPFASDAPGTDVVEPGHEQPVHHSVQGVKVYRVSLEDWRNCIREAIATDLGRYLGQRILPYESVVTLDNRP